MLLATLARCLAASLAADAFGAAEGRGGERRSEDAGAADDVGGAGVPGADASGAASRGDVKMLGGVR